MEQDNKINFSEEYAPVLPKKAIDIGDGIIEENEEITPFDIIKNIAEKLGQTINDPKKDCKKCHGRGYIGRDAETKSPIPCACIYPNTNNDVNNRIYNKIRKKSRAERRRIEKEQRKYIKKLK